MVGILFIFSINMGNSPVVEKNFRIVLKTRKFLLTFVFGLLAPEK